MHPEQLKPSSPKRRALLQGIATTIGLAGLPALGRAEDECFASDFVWGVAASAAQTESRTGRGRSNWDEFADRTGTIADGSTNARCTGFEQNFASDIAMLAAAGVKAFRFSIGWPRVQPNGPGAASAAG